MRFLLGLLIGIALGFGVTTYLNQQMQEDDESPT
jgi:ABC-type lipoprotein release transport system permease subunit